MPWKYPPKEIQLQLSFSCCCLSVQLTETIRAGSIIFSSLITLNFLFFFFISERERIPTNVGFSSLLAFPIMNSNLPSSSLSSRVVSNNNDKPKRLYQAWKGSNRFLCGGRLIFGPDVSSMFLSTLLIAGPAVAFCVKTYLKIGDKDFKHHEYWYPVLIVCAVLTLLDLAFLLLTSSRDPGIVSRSSRPPESDETLYMNTPSMEWVNGRTPHLKLPRTKDVMVNGHAVKVKYCDTCFLYRPPRASHCSICNNCVQRFDHHCPWVGQCIGIRNYRFFFMFISTATILCVYVFVFSWIHILSSKKHIWKAISGDILSDFLIIYCFIAVWFVGGLTIFHSYLICTNQTTYENFRYRYDKKENPYNRGTVNNIMEVFFTKIPPSMNKFRSFVEEDESIVATPAMPSFGDGFANSKEKIDIEMGTKNSEGSNYSLPEILRNLDYDDEDDSEDNIKPKQGEGKQYSGSFFPNDQEEKESLQFFVGKDEMRASIQGSHVYDGLKDSALSSRYSMEIGDGIRGCSQRSNAEVEVEVGKSAASSETEAEAEVTKAANSSYVEDEVRDATTNSIVVDVTENTASNDDLSFRPST
ncbi:probable protein S-acyltransferase 4 [Euphorbia lathyris]|uniref:probable protein S-acyltransferase 4 n=1 Tax=Euphorbia lathyris TaxID=212925 RepID=UPI003313E297